MTLKQRLLAAAASPAIAQTMPAAELGSGTVIPLRRLSLGERKHLVELANDKTIPAPERQIQILAVVIADESGARAFPFTTDAAGDRQALEAMPALLADRIVEQTFHLITSSTATKESVAEGKGSSGTTTSSI